MKKKEKVEKPTWAEKVAKKIDNLAISTEEFLQQKIVLPLKLNQESNKDSPDKDIRKHSEELVGLAKELVKYFKKTIAPESIKEIVESKIEYISGSIKNKTQPSLQDKFLNVLAEFCNEIGLTKPAEYLKSKISTRGKILFGINTISSEAGKLF